MTDFLLQCPHCQQSLKAPEEMRGESIDCPACGGKLVLPKSDRQRVPSPAPNETEAKKTSGIHIVRSWLDNYADAKEKRRAEEEALEQKRLKDEQQERKAERLRTSDQIKLKEEHLGVALIDKVASIRQTILQGRTLFMYRTEFVPVDFSLDGCSRGSHTIEKIQSMGLNGWEAVGIIPRTEGLTLTNSQYLVDVIAVKMSEAHAGGIGGMVNGAYILLRKVILVSDTDPVPSEEFLEYLRNHTELASTISEINQLKDRL